MEHDPENDDRCSRCTWLAVICLWTVNQTKLIAGAIDLPAEMFSWD